MGVGGPPPGRPVMVDVARRAGVSQKTVSRVVNGQPNVSAEVSTRVQQAIKELGFRPNAAARALVSQRARTLGILTPATALYGPTANLLGMERATWEAGYSVVIISIQDPTPDTVGAAVSRLLDSGVDGVLISSSVLTEPIPLGVLNGVPAVIVGDPPPAGSDLPATAIDQQTGVRAAVEHLLSQGHRTVHHIAGPMSWHAARVRTEVWSTTLEAAGAPVTPVVRGDWSARSGYEAGLLLAANPEVTAVFSANDQMAIGLLRALAESGRRVPQDVSVVGFDGIPEAAYLPVPLTTVHQDFEEVSARAVARLVHEITGEVIPERTPSTPRLVVRASSGPAPSAGR